MRVIACGYVMLHVIHHSWMMNVYEWWMYDDTYNDTYLMKMTMMFDTQRNDEGFSTTININDMQHATWIWNRNFLGAMFGGKKNRAYFFEKKKTIFECRKLMTFWVNYLEYYYRRNKMTIFSLYIWT